MTAGGMLAMQYRFVLPADYDMAVIRARIAGKGHLMDDFPGLACKAYLYSSRAPEEGGGDNRYAPFYLWADPEGMNRFLAGPGFAALTAAFGWPSVRLWSVWRAQLPAAVLGAGQARCEILPIAPHGDLAALREAEEARLAADIADGRALGGACGFEPGGWSLVRFRLGAGRPVPDGEAPGSLYRVGHLSLPGRGDTP